MSSTLGTRHLLRFSDPDRPGRVGRSACLATQAGMPRRSSCDRARYSLGVLPMSSVNRALNEPSEVQPTAMHTSVTDSSPRRSSAAARSTRRVMRCAYGVSP